MSPLRKLTYLVPIIVASATAACTFEPGEPWGYIDAKIQAHTVLDSGAVTIDSQHMTLGEMELRAPGQSTGAVEDFDPSDPPPGFYLCHQNHCHHEDGNLYSYDEIESGVAVDSEGPVNVARRTLNAEYSLNESPRHHEQFRIVDEVTLNETALTIDSLVLKGELEEGGETYDLEISLGMASRSLSTPIFYEVGSDSEEFQEMQLEIMWPDDLFDDLDSYFADAVENASSGDTVAVHGTSNTGLRAELIERIQTDTTYTWVEE